MNERLTDNDFHSKEQKERACYIQEPRLQAIYDKCFEYEDIDTNPERLKNTKKALEIIKEKEVNVYDFKEYESKYEYNKHTKAKFQELTQEEYDLLKEVLYGKETS